MRRLKIIIAASLLTAVFSAELQGVMQTEGQREGMTIAFTEEVFSVPQAHAQEAINALLNQKQKPGSFAQKLFSGILEIFVVLNWLALTGVQALLDPDIIFGELKGGVRPVEPILRNIWVTSRNIVNGIFAFILLFAGIYQIGRAHV